MFDRSIRTSDDCIHQIALQLSSAIFIDDFNFHLLRVASGLSGFLLTCLNLFLALCLSFF
jgi:hypothetical protein